MLRGSAGGGSVNALEYCGIAFLAMVAIFTVALVLVQITGGVDLFDDKQAGEEIDRLIKEADEAVAKRPRVRAVSTFQGE